MLRLYDDDTRRGQVRSLSLLNQTAFVAVVDWCYVIRRMEVTQGQETHHDGNKLETLCTLSTTWTTEYKYCVGVLECWSAGEDQWNRKAENDVTGSRFYGCRITKYRSRTMYAYNHVSAYQLSTRSFQKKYESIRNSNMRTTVEKRAKKM